MAVGGGDGEGEGEEGHERRSDDFQGLLGDRAVDFDHGYELIMPFILVLRMGYVRSNTT